MARGYWTEEKVEELKTLWNTGMTAAQVASTLKDVSRSAILGKIHRLDLPKRIKAPKEKPPRTYKSRRNSKSGRNKPSTQSSDLSRRRPRQLKYELAMARHPKLLADGTFADIITVKEHMCKWPYNDPQDKDFKLCGHPAQHQSSYCALHAQVAHR